MFGTPNQVYVVCGMWYCLATELGAMDTQLRKQLLSVYTLMT